jgi:nitronate monooxygenase
METPFTRLVGCSVPIQQAPMGAVSSPELAVAVADAGGVGTITALRMPVDHLDRMLVDMAAKTHGVLAANFLTSELDRDAVAAAASRVRLIDFFWADPDPALVELAHSGGALASWQVGSVAEARAAVDAGCDLVIAQGTEAGGHIRGHQPLLTVLREVLDAVDVPVLAAGGIADAESFARVLAEGAAGARIGTRFIATSESGAHPTYKQAVVNASGGSTEITDAFAVCPLCATSPRARVLRSAIEAVRNTDAEAVGETVMAGEKVPVPRGSGMPPSATTTGDISAMALYAGESVAAVHDIMPVAQVIETLCALVPR